jgi:hypothetical protein
MTLPKDTALSVKGTTPFKCPCCDGWGRRYDPGPVATAINVVACVACNGTGIIWSPRILSEQKGGNGK